LFNWLYARKFNGVFVLRIEDTDKERSSAEAVQAIMDGMDWLGLTYDEGPFFQTQRFPRYRQVIEQLLDEGKAYRCYSSKEDVEAMRVAARACGEKPRYDGHWRDRADPPPKGVEPVIRFKNPLEGEVEVADQVRGLVTFRNEELDDLVIARADGTPTYHLTVCVDDMDMQISHVIRGDDHLNNTPRQINILNSLGAALPVYAHVPMILGADGKRLSKRHGAVSVMTYRDEGYLPEALLNYLVRLGWAHGDQEIFELDELVEKFDITNVNKAAGTFDNDKLQWLNQHYIKSAPEARLAGLLETELERQSVAVEGGIAVGDVATALKERAKTMVEMAESARYFFATPTRYEEKARKHLNGSILTELRSVLADMDPWVESSIHAALAELAEAKELKLGKVAQPLRVALTGGTVSPPIDVTAMLIGQQETLARLDTAIAYSAEL